MADRAVENPSLHTSTWTSLLALGEAVFDCLRSGLPMLSSLCDMHCISGYLPRAKAPFSDRVSRGLTSRLKMGVWPYLSIAPITEGLHKSYMTLEHESSGR
jgi:hypothetical protein